MRVIKWVFAVLEGSRVCLLCGLGRGGGRGPRSWLSSVHDVERLGSLRCSGACAPGVGGPMAGWCWVGGGVGGEGGAHGCGLECRRGRRWGRMCGCFGVVSRGGGWAWVVVVGEGRGGGGRLGGCGTWGGVGQPLGNGREAGEKGGGREGRNIRGRKRPNPNKGRCPMALMKQKGAAAADGFKVRNIERATLDGGSTGGNREEIEEYRKESTGIREEGSRRGKYGRLEYMLKDGEKDTNSDATLYSSSSDKIEESANETDDADESDMDLSNDNLDGDDDAIGYGVFMHNKSTVTPNSTYLSLMVTSSSLDFIQTLVDETPANELTDFMSAFEVPLVTPVDVLATKTLLQEMFTDKNAHHLSSPPATKTSYPTTYPQPRSLQAKAKKLMQKAKKNMRSINFKKAVVKNSENMIRSWKLSQISMFLKHLKRLSKLKF
ncbi:hypothetical protein Tco_0001575 [Tanacetum coccineum]